MCLCVYERDVETQNQERVHEREVTENGVLLPTIRRRSMSQFNLGSSWFGGNRSIYWAPATLSVWNRQDKQGWSLPGGEHGCSRGQRLSCLVNLGWDGTLFTGVDK